MSGALSELNRTVLRESQCFFDSPLDALHEIVGS